jgi:hypothetical protein
MNRNMVTMSITDIDSEKGLYCHSKNVPRSAGGRLVGGHTVKYLNKKKKSRCNRRSEKEKTNVAHRICHQN